MESVEVAEGRLSGMQEKMLLLAHGAPVRGREWMQMGMFLLSRIYGGLGREAGYGAGPEGPRSAAVEGCVERLAGAGMLEEGAGGIALTDAGMGAVRRIRAEADKEMIEDVESTKEFVNALSADELLCYAFTDFPGLSTESPRREEITRRAETILLGMVWGDKISLSKAARLSGKSIEHVMDRLRYHGYRVFA